MGIECLHADERAGYQLLAFFIALRNPFIERDAKKMVRLG